VDAHVHVQCFDMNGEEMEDLYDLCQREGKPMVIHAGREPKSQKYPCDPYEICRAEKLELVLQSFPMVRICVPHLGVDEFGAYKNLIEQYDNLL
jgi:predicted TIM-barrel fold metal-dependent hydrolase